MGTTTWYRDVGGDVFFVMSSFERDSSDSPSPFDTASEAVELTGLRGLATRVLLVLSEQEAPLAVLCSDSKPTDFSIKQLL